MTKGAKLFITLAGIIMPGAWTLKNGNDIKKAEWLIGTWENKTPKGSVYETRSKTNERV